MQDLTRPAWAEANCELDAYELAVCVSDPQDLNSEHLALAVTAALRRLYAAYPGKVFGAVRFERMPWGLYGQLLAKDLPAVPLPMPLMLTAAALAWFTRRKEEVARGALCGAVAVALSAFTPIERGWCEQGRCTTITTDDGVCPPGSAPEGRHCVFLSEGER